MKHSLLVWSRDSCSYCVLVKRRTASKDTKDIVDHKAIPCKAQTSLTAFDELFKAHLIFSVNYHESFNIQYTFIQTSIHCSSKTQSNIDAGRAKESLRVKELRARFLHAWGDKYPWMQICFFVMPVRHTTNVLHCFVSTVYILERLYVSNVDSGDVVYLFAPIQVSSGILFKPPVNIKYRHVPRLWSDCNLSY